MRQGLETSYRPTGRTSVRRLAERGRYDRATVHGILDEGLVCHAGFVAGGQPYVIPTLYVRDGDTLYFHGSTGSRTLRALTAGADVCLTVTLLDGLVLARSVFHHSVNYRSVMVLGRAEPVEDTAERLLWKLSQLARFGLTAAPLFKPLVRGFEDG